MHLCNPLPKYSTHPTLKCTPKNVSIKRGLNTLHSCTERRMAIESGTRGGVSHFIKHKESPTAVSGSLGSGIWIAKREPEQWCQNTMAAQSGVSGTFWGQAFWDVGHWPQGAMSGGVRQGPRGPGWGSGGSPGGRGRPGRERVGGAWLVTWRRARGGRWAACGPRVSTWLKLNEWKWDERKISLQRKRKREKERKGKIDTNFKETQKTKAWGG